MPHLALCFAKLCLLVAMATVSVQAGGKFIQPKCGISGGQQRLPGNELITLEMIVSDINCARKCHRNNTCKAFNYQKGKKVLQEQYM